MAALDRELGRGETLAARLDDLDRLMTPVRLLARSMMNAGQRFRARTDRAPRTSRSRMSATDELDL